MNRHLLSFLFILIHSISWGQSNKESYSFFQNTIQWQNLESEQILPGTAPKGSDPIHSNLFKNYFKSFGMTGNIPEIYWPMSAKVFEMKTILIPAEEADIVSSLIVDESILKVSSVVLNNKKYYRYFIHPLEFEKIHSSFMESPLDPVQWIATPTSSSRSLIISDKDKNFMPFIAKTAMNNKMAGFLRTINRDYGINAVTSNAIYQEMFSQTAGKIPNTNKTWNYYSESMAMGSKKHPELYTIMRGFPSHYNKNIYLPFYALISERENNKRWIDILYQNSNYKNKLQFAWQEIVKPMLELDILLRFDHGIISDPHQQNIVIVVSPETNNIVGFSLRDLDQNWIDYPVRKYILKKTTPDLTHQNSETHHYLEAIENPMFSYEVFKDSIIKNIFSFFLDKDEIDRMVGGGNDLILKAFNQRYSHLVGETTHYLDIKNSFSKMREVNLSKNEKRFFIQQALENKKKTSFIEGVGTKVLNNYYLLKQKLEKNGISPDLGDESKPIIDLIKTEAYEILPKNIVNFWISKQDVFSNNISEIQALTFEDELILKKIQTLSMKLPNIKEITAKINSVLLNKKISALEMREIVFDYISKLESNNTKVKADFHEDIDALKKLYKSTRPFLYIAKDLTVDDIILLSALPINPIGITEKVIFADGHKLPPVEFALHDEIHFFGAASAEDKYLSELGILSGTPKHYEEILKRLRFTKNFLIWVNNMNDPIDKDIAKGLWFDAFHEYLPSQLPSREKYFTGYYPSAENLKKYVSQYLNSDLQLCFIERMRLQYPFLEKFRMTYGKSSFNRFVSGDFLSQDTNEKNYSKQRIIQMYQKINQFAEQVSSNSLNDLLSNSLGKSTAELPKPKPSFFCDKMFVNKQ